MNEQESQVKDVKEDTTTTASEPKQPIDNVPYARFKELVDEKNTMKQEFESLQNTIKKQEEERKLSEMEAKGDYEKIITDMKGKLETADSKAKEWDNYRANRRDSLLSKIPEDDRAIYDGLTLDKLEAHVNKFNNQVSPAKVDNSTPTALGGYATMEEWAANDPKGYKNANEPQTSGKIRIAYE